MTDRRLLRVLQGERVDTVPVWMMRQAGRHLPEYRETRAKARDFLDFCYTPALAAEATLQPVRRYGMDGAILFADILLILDAMGRNVRFLEGEGPRVDPATKASDLSKVPMEKILAHLAPVGETVERVRASLDNSTTLIGFAGSPWTVGVYAIEGRGGTDKADSRLFGYEHPQDLDGMLEQLVEASAHYLKMQADAGADALMLFESWAEGLPEDAFERWVIGPTAALVKRVRELGVKQPILGFPRGAGGLVVDYAERTGVNAVGLDTAIPLKRIDAMLPKGMPVQGNLDPMRLVAGGPDMEARVREIITTLKGRPHIFNLGHGVTPEVPIPHVESVLRTIRSMA
ncbi:MAG TPA: uroporphyrinogen decarboxylase [Hyphomonadaceae bacterium]|nr:uroporphyrinogen decarboxylase [Hyphomonadaceae bacterium]HPN06118.1 uroporphyrinogen decarboxylase [Hyphomonadaceae bacterium]